MRIRFLANTNIRSDPHDLSISPMGIVFMGVEIEVEDRLYKGAPFDNINTYFRDSRGWYYWSGKAAIIYKELPPANHQKTTHPEPVSEPVGGSWTLPVEEKYTESKEENSYPIQQEIPGVLGHKTAPEDKDQPDDDFEEEIYQPPEKSLFYHDKEEENEPIITPDDLPSVPTKEEKVFSLIAQYQITHPLLSNVSKSFNIPQIWQEEEVFGKNISVALLDGKIETHHPDLQDNILEEFDAGDAKNLSGLSTDQNASLRAGLIAGQGNQSLLGICPLSTLFCANIYENSYKVHFDHLLESLTWAMSHKVDFIFTSADLREDVLSGKQRKQLSDAGRTLHQMGILLVAPVGNGQSVKPENRYPACLPHSLSVGAVDRSNTIASYSLRSAAIDVVAPGEDLYVHKRKTSVKSTAESAALVTGIAALLLEIGRKRKPNLKATHLKEILRFTAIPKFPISKCRDLSYGCGTIHVQGALEKIRKM